MITYAKHISQFVGGSFAYTGVFEGSTITQTIQSFNGALGAAGFGLDNEDDERPYAYLNYILFDENKVMLDAGWQRVPEEAGFDPGEEALPNRHVRVAFNQPVVVLQNGYIYVWVSNESENTKVWFDDLRVTHTQTIVTQATDYGVWGDVLREMKSAEITYRHGYQGQFAEKDKETGWSHFELREYDAIIGRWLVPDPYAQYWSPYNGMGNDPVNSTDPDGGYSKFGAWWRNGFSMTGVYESDGEWGFNTGSNEFSNGYFNCGCKGSISNSSNIWEDSGEIKKGLFNSKYKIEVGHLSYYNNTGEGELMEVLPFPTAISFGGEASALKGEIENRYGSDEYNVFLNGNGSVGTGKGNIDAGFFSGEGGKRGIIADGNVGAYTAKGEITVGATIHGVKMSGTFGGSVESAHIGGTIGVYTDGKFINIAGAEHLGLGIGQKMAFLIQIPYSK